MCDVCCDHDMVCLPSVSGLIDHPAMRHTALCTVSRQVPMDVILGDGSHVLDLPTADVKPWLAKWYTDQTSLRDQHVLSHEFLMNILRTHALPFVNTCYSEHDLARELCYCTRM